jgi:IclR family transcriptional regulator, mhp operon transcriptional activator
MDTARVRSIASLKRGLEVLSLLHARDGVQLRELHEASGVPKASLLRVLKTLIEHRWVRRRAADGAYLASVLPQGPAQQDTQPGAASRPLAAEVLAGALRDLRQTLSWPSDVAVRHGGVMRVIDSNRSAYGRVWRLPGLFIAGGEPGLDRPAARARGHARPTPGTAGAGIAGHAPPRIRGA